MNCHRLSQLGNRCWRVGMLVVLGCMIAVSCVPASTSTDQSNAAAELAPTTLPGDDAAGNDSYRGVALSPRSYDGGDFPDFLDIVDGSVDLLMHAGDWHELADETSAFRVAAELAGQRDLETMIVLSPSNGTGLLRPLDQPTIDSYLASLRTFLREFQPAYLGLGNELNLVESRSPAEFEQAVELYEAALLVVRELAPDTTVFVTLQYEWLLGQHDGWFGRTHDPSLAQWSLIERFSSADAIGITTYPGLVFDTPADVPDDYYDQIREHTDMPVLITESGWSANPVAAIRPGSERDQTAWSEALIRRARRLDAQVVIWTFVFSAQVTEPAFADMGLWADDGTARPAWNVWQGATESLTESWRLPLPGDLPLTALADASGRPFVYVAAKNGGVVVIESSPGRGDVVARVPVQALEGADAIHLDQRGDLLVVALGDFFGQSTQTGMAIIDVGNPIEPAVVGTWISEDRLDGAADLVLDDTTVFLAAMHHGIVAIDIADPLNPSQIGRLDLDPDFPLANASDVARPNARGLAVAGDRLYVANDAGGLRVVDIADPAALHEIGRYINPHATKQQAYNDVLVVDGLAYVSLDYCGFEVIDVGSASAMSQVAWLDPWDCNGLTNLWLNSPGHGNELAFDAGRQTIWMSAGDSELLGVDVRDPANPVISHQIGEPGNDRGSYGLGATSGPDAQVFVTYIVTVIPFQGRTSEIVALTPS